MALDDTGPIPRASKTYSGTRTSAGCVVAVTTIQNGRPSSRLLDLQLAIRKHAQQFDWGNLGRGSHQLALAILANHTHDSRRAAELHLQFAAAVVARLPHDAWTLTDAEIDDALGRLERP
jgi:hypothetical protein